MWRLQGVSRKKIREKEEDLVFRRFSKKKK
jgi:hypothetical protein